MDNKKKINVMVWLSVIFLLVSSIFVLYLYEESFQDMEKSREADYETLNDIYNRQLLLDYREMLYFHQQIEEMDDDNWTGNVDYWQDKIDNYEYVEFYRPIPRLSILESSLLQLIPIGLLSIFMFYIGKSVGDVDGGAEDGKEK